MFRTVENNVPVPQSDQRVVVIILTCNRWVPRPPLSPAGPSVAPVAGANPPSPPGKVGLHSRKRHHTEHRPQRPTTRSDPPQHAKGRRGHCPGPRRETATRRTSTDVTQGGGGLEKRFERPPPPTNLPPLPQCLDHPHPPSLRHKGRPSAGVQVAHSTASHWADQRQQQQEPL